MTSYNNLTLYYLNQMGIVPWVSRVQEKEPLRLVVIASSQTPKANTLLTNVLAFIGLSKESVRIIQDPKTKELTTQDAASLVAVLSLGFSSEDYPVSCKQFIAEDLEFVLKNPLRKKALFNTLLSLKACLLQQGLCV